MGLTAYAQKELGDILKVVLPVIGNNVSLGEKIGEPEGTTGIEDIYSPITGSITQINTQLFETPKLLNTYADIEWLFQVNVKEPSEITELKSKGDYESFLKKLSLAETP